MKTLDQKIDSGREYRSMQMNAVEDSHIVRGYATTYNSPYTLYTTKNNDGKEVEVREQVDAHAFDGADMNDVIMQYDHAGRVFARTSNETLRLTPTDEHGLLVEADLGKTTIGRELYEEINGGFTTKMSFGFTVTDDDFQEAERDENRVVYLRTIKSIGKLYDVSAVSLPANDGTEISARKVCDGVIADLEAERLLAEKKAEEKRALMERVSKLMKGQD